MKTKIFLLLASVLTVFSLKAQIPAGYYNAANGLEGYALKTALSNIIDGHNSHSYDALYDGYETTDTDNYYENDGTVLDMYSENPSGTDPYNYTHGNRQCGNYSSENDCYNREHIFPQGFFNEASPMKSDIHFVVPSDGKVNGMRNNYPFGEVGSASFTSLNGSKLGSCVSPGYSGTVFEPIDEFKGDIARMLLYFVTRYQTQLSSFSPSDSNNPLDGSTGQSFETWQVNVLLSWHELDPVSQREIDRNEAAYDWQNNRNPFIDHPEYVRCIWATCSGITFTSSPALTAMETSPYTYNITYNVDNETETLSCTQKPAWLTFTKNEANNTASLSGTPAIGDADTYEVTLVLTEGENTETQTFTITVSPFASIVTLLDEDFSSCTLTGWQTISVASNKNWSCGSGYISINAYGGDAASNDWLISPEFNLNNYQDEVLTFIAYTQYTDGGITNPEVKLKYTTGYTGSPSTTTWTNLTYTSPAENSLTNTASGNIDLSAINGTAFRFAFNYTSSGTASSSSSLWRIDDVMLTAETIGAISTITDNGVRIIPNPAGESIRFSQTLTGNLCIYSIAGVKLIETELKQTETNISMLKSGIYFAHITDKKGNVTVMKFIKL